MNDWFEVPKNRVLTADENNEFFGVLCEEIKKCPHTIIPDEFENKALPFLLKHGYFRWPASVRYHLNEEGGLCRHSVKVTLNALQLNSIWHGLPEWKVILAGLFHDLGKLGNVCQLTEDHWPRYAKDPDFGIGVGEVVKDEKTGFTFMKKPEGRLIYPFKYGPSCQRANSTDYRNDVVFMSMTDLDAILPAQLMTLPADVIQACKFADGIYVPENKSYHFLECPLSNLIHTADYFTGIIQEGGRL